VRTSWLFGLAADNLVEAVLDAAADSDVVPVAADTKSCPTFTRHLSEALVHLVENPAFGVFHVTGRGSCTKLQFARNVLRIAGLRARVVPLLDRGVGDAPRNLVLTTRRMEIPRLPRWQAGVHAYLDARASAFAS
jgi:dTDP-4-dehydrorhamnose reductase